MNSKIIEDYLHLYLGCKVKWMYGNEIYILVRTDKINCDLYNGATLYTSIRNIKPILRALSDMTEEEKKEYQFMKPDSGVENSDPYQPYINLNAKRTLWALSKHLDLFNLIKSDLAIDASTIKQ